MFMLTDQPKIIIDFIFKKVKRVKSSQKIILTVKYDVLKNG